ncbi:hypothetical protein ABT147_10590 [Streptomyces sp. NPDC001868]|uniref:hypothetical protein n=1 Tax=Streptomyces sp. NPDC001868 TaxID=3154401 RepID=UPI00332BE7A9
MTRKVVAATGFHVRVRNAWARRTDSGAGHLRVLRAQLRRGPAAPGAAVFTVVLLLTAWPSRTSPHEEAWHGDWINTSAVLGSSLAFGLPVAVGVACWQGGAQTRAGMRWAQEQAVRPPVARALLACAPSVLWPLTAFLAFTLLLMGMTWWTATAGAPPCLEAAYSTLLLTALTALAHVLGELLPLRVVPVLAAVGSALLLSLNSARTSYGSLANGLTFYDVTPDRRYTGRPVPGYEDDFGSPSAYDYWETSAPSDVTWPYWLLLALLATATATAVGVLARRWLPVALLCAALTSAAVLPVDYAATRPEPVLMAVRCSRGTPVLCLSDDRAAFHQESRRMVAHFAARLADVRGAPSHYLATAETGRGCRSPGPYTSPRGWTVEFAATDAPDIRFDEVAHDIAMSCSLGSNDSQRHAEYLVAAVHTWLVPVERRGPHTRPPAVRRAVARLSALPHRTRAAWLTDYFTALRRDSPIPGLPAPGADSPSRKKPAR